ncbi:MAG: sigma-70 family RNA polymerase sigma factor [Ornithinimicrobium sp.]
MTVEGAAVRCRSTVDAPAKEKCVCRFCLVASHLDVADASARRFRGRGESLEDLVQVARLGLVLAAGRYDPATGTPFVGFALPTIVGELRRHLRDQVWGVRPPRSLQELRPQVVAAREGLTQRLRRVPRVDEIAAELALPTATVAEAMSLDTAYRPDSLDDADQGVSRPAEILIAPRTRMDELEGRLTLEPGFAELPESNRRVLRLHFIADLSQRSIAAEVGVSQMQVSRILRQSLKRMRRTMDITYQDARTS